jgi:hypothetical protein
MFGPLSRTALTVMIGTSIGCRPESPTPGVTQEPQYTAAVLKIEEPTGDAAFDPIGEDPTGSRTYQYVEEFRHSVSWKFVRRKGSADVYEFKIRHPSPEGDVEVQRKADYSGGETLVYERDGMRVSILPKMPEY